MHRQTLLHGRTDEHPRRCGNAHESRIDRLDIAVDGVREHSRGCGDRDRPERDRSCAAQLEASDEKEHRHDHDAAADAEEGAEEAGDEPDQKEPHRPYATEVVAVRSDALIERLVADPRHAALLLDFDGVLAPIVARPDDARPSPGTRSELERLADRYALVAIVSGRAGDDVRHRVGVAAITYVGSHGLELEPQAERWRKTLAAFAADAPWPARDIESKGLSISFHYRNRADERQAVRELEAIADEAREEGLVARFGRKVLEVLPPVGSNKGTAVRHLLEERRLRRALVAGDDTTDLDSFRALDDLELAVRVAVATPEAPTLLLEAADVVVDGQAAFLELLRRL